MILDLIGGHPLWWYNLSFILFGLALFGLLLLVREGYTAFSNISRYGLHPDTEKILREREEQRKAAQRARSPVKVDTADNYPDGSSTQEATPEEYRHGHNYPEDEE